MTDDELVAELVSRAVASTVEKLFANQARGDLLGFALGTDDDVCAIHPFACPSAWLLQEQAANPELRYVFTDWIDLDGSAFADLAECLQRFSARDYGRGLPASRILDSVDVNRIGYHRHRIVYFWTPPKPEHLSKAGSRTT